MSDTPDPVHTPDPMRDTADLVSDLAEAARVAADAIAGAGSVADLRVVEAASIGRHSAFAGLQRRLAGLGDDERRRAGAEINEARARLAAAVADRRAILEAAERVARLAADRLDLTEAEALGRRAWTTGLPDRGHLHLVTRTRHALEDTFVGMGFAVAEGPEAETDWYNFEALNLPPGHPARSLWDTLYLDLGEPGSILLRTHTSPTQVHVMESQAPPIYAVAPGRVYRRETEDARHLAVFHQIEGLVVDKGITFGDLAGTIEAFTGAFFGSGIHSRLRPSYFPFTEPSAEFDVTCPICAGAGCRTCSGSGWIELGGCGMVDPNVFEAVGIDAEVYTGFAFGFGIDRLAMIAVGLGDLRQLLENDLRFLHQF